MDHLSSSTEFVLHKERRVLAVDNKAYRTLNPLADFGDLRNRNHEIEVQVLRHRDLLNEGMLRTIDPLDINSMAWATLELGYSAVRQASNARRDVRTQAQRQLESNIQLAGKFFDAITWLAKKEPSRYDDEETYFAALGSSALQFAQPLEPGSFQEALRNQYTQTIRGLVLAHAHLAHARSERKGRAIITPLVGVRAQLIGMACLMRPINNDAGALQFLAMPPSTRHRNTFRSASVINNHWNVSVWQIPPEQCGTFTLATPPDIKWRMRNFRTEATNDGYSVRSINLAENILAKNEENDFSLLVSTAFQELEPPGRQLDANGVALLDASSRRAQALAVAHMH